MLALPPAPQAEPVGRFPAFRLRASGRRPLRLPARLRADTRRSRAGGGASTAARHSRGKQSYRLREQVPRKHGASSETALSRQSFLSLKETWALIKMRIKADSE